MPNTCTKVWMHVYGIGLEILKENRENEKYRKHKDQKRLI